MARNVGTSSEVARAFLRRQAGPHRNHRETFYFHGPVLYSYGSHFEVARFVENQEGRKALLVTDRFYSSTTAKHVAEVRRKAGLVRSDDVTVFHVNPQCPLDLTVRILIGEAQDEAEKFPRRMKDSTRRMAHGNIHGLLTKARELVAFFHLNIQVPEIEKLSPRSCAWFAEHEKAQVEQEQQRRFMERMRKQSEESAGAYVPLGQALIPQMDHDALASL